MGTDERPNVLFLFTDDQRFDTIRALGNAQIQTPNMDALVEAGTAFTHAAIMGGTSGAVCMPSRAMMLTGRTLFHLQECGATIPPDHVMFPEALREVGYTTFGTGKWHNGRAAHQRCFTQGGRIFFGGMSPHFEVPVYDYDPEGAYPEGGHHVESGRHSSDLFSEAAVRFLESYDGPAPFFAYVSYTAPHDPRDTHPRYHEMYDPDEIPLPENFLPEHPFDNGEMTIRDEQLAPWPRTPEIIRRHIADYYAMITHADATIGRILAALQESGRAENTILVFAGDNGLAVGRHGLMGKQNLYEHSIRVPLVMAGPGIPSGERRETPCYLLDIYPTLFELLGLNVPESVEGLSLLPALQEERQKVRNSQFYAYRHFQRALRRGRHKLIEYSVNGHRTTQLFDLKNDPCETENLCDGTENAETMRELRAELHRWQQRTEDPNPDAFKG